MPPVPGQPPLQQSVPDQLLEDDAILEAVVQPGSTRSHESITTISTDTEGSHLLNSTGLDQSVVIMGDTSTHAIEVNDSIVEIADNTTTSATISNEVLPATSDKQTPDQNNRQLTETTAVEASSTPATSNPEAVCQEDQTMDDTEETQQHSEGRPTSESRHSTPIRDQQENPFMISGDLDRLNVHPEDSDEEFLEDSSRRDWQNEKSVTKKSAQSASHSRTRSSPPKGSKRKDPDQQRSSSSRDSASSKGLPDPRDRGRGTSPRRDRVSKEGSGRSHGSARSEGERSSRYDPPRSSRDSSRSGSDRDRSHSDRDRSHSDRDRSHQDRDRSHQHERSRYHHDDHRTPPRHSSSRESRHSNQAHSDQSKQSSANRNRFKIPHSVPTRSNRHTHRHHQDQFREDDDSEGSSRTVKSVAVPKTTKGKETKKHSKPSSSENKSSRSKGATAKPKKATDASGSSAAESDKSTREKSPHAKKSAAQEVSCASSFPGVEPLTITVQNDTRDQAMDTTSSSQNRPKSPTIFPSPRTGYDQWPPNYGVADIDHEMSHGRFLYSSPDTIKDNERDRNHLKALKGWAKDLSKPSEEIKDPILDPRPTQQDPPRLGRGEYDSLEEVVNADCPSTIWISWIEDEEVRDTLRARLIEIPEGPNVYPLISRWTEHMHHQHAIPSQADICPNFYLSLVRLFGEGYAQGQDCEDDPEKNSRVQKLCPEHSEGCPWHAMTARNFRDHYNLSHLPFPLLLLCPAAEYECPYVTGSACNFKNHLISCEKDYQAAQDHVMQQQAENDVLVEWNQQHPDEAPRLLNVIDAFPSATERIHHEMYLQMISGDDSYKADISLVRVFNRKVQIPTGLPPVVCFQPTNSVVPPTPTAQRAKERWLAQARADGLELMPGYQNTVSVVHADDDRTPIEKAIVNAFRGHGRQDRSLKKTAQECKENRDTWSREELLRYEMPKEPRKTRARTKTSTQASSSSREPSIPRSYVGSDLAGEITEHEDEDESRDVCMTSGDEYLPVNDELDTSEQMEDEQLTATSSPRSTRSSKRKADHVEDEEPVGRRRRCESQDLSETESERSTIGALSYTDLRAQLSTQHSPETYRQLTSQAQVQLTPNPHLAASTASTTTTASSSQQQSQSTRSVPKMGLATSSPAAGTTTLPAFQNVSSVMQDTQACLDLADFHLPKKPTRPAPFEVPPLVATTEEGILEHARNVERLRVRHAEATRRYEVDIEEWYQLRYSILTQYISHHLNTNVTHTPTLETMEQYRAHQLADKYFGGNQPPKKH